MTNCLGIIIHTFELLDEGMLCAENTTDKKKTSLKIKTS